MTAPTAVGRYDAATSLNVQGKRGKKNKNKKSNNNVRNEREMELTIPAEDGMVVPKSVQESKILFYKPSIGEASIRHEDVQQMAENEAGSQSGPMDTLEGSGEHSPIIEKNASQTTDNNQIAITVASPRERIKDYAENPPNFESASGKCMYNKEQSDVLSIPSVSEIKFAKIEVHQRVRRRRHFDTEVSIDKLFNLTSDKAMDMRENDEVSDEDSISVNFAASWERERYF
ncbi:hypothetical protein SCA6_007260 [Theobroma cacao]